MQGGTVDLTLSDPSWAPRDKSVCKDPRLRLKVHHWIRQLKITLYLVVLAPFPPQLSPSLPSGGYISVSQFKEKSPFNPVSYRLEVRIFFILDKM